MSKNNKIITYNAQGQLVIDQSIPKYENVPNNDLFSHSEEYDISYSNVPEKTDEESWDSTRANESTYSKDIKYRAKNIKLTVTDEPWYLKNNDIIHLIAENNIMIQNKFSVENFVKEHIKFYRELLL